MWEGNLIVSKGVVCKLRHAKTRIYRYYHPICNNFSIEYSFCLDFYPSPIKHDIIWGRPLDVVLVYRNYLLSLGVPKGGSRVFKLVVQEDCTNFFHAVLSAVMYNNSGSIRFAVPSVGFTVLLRAGCSLYPRTMVSEIVYCWTIVCQKIFKMAISLPQAKNVWDSLSIP